MKKNYIQPSVEQAQLMAGSVILTSPTDSNTLPVNPDPIPNLEGGD